MLLRTLVAIVALANASTELQALAQNQPSIFKSHDEKECCEGPRGHEGERGKEGKKGKRGRRGIPGTTVQNVMTNGVYAHAFLQQDPESNGQNLPLNSPIIFNQLTQAQGVDTSLTLTNGSFMIQSAGDYLISYYIYADDIFAPGNVYLTVLLNGSHIEQSVVGNFVNSQVFPGPVIPISGKMILHLNAGDMLQLEVIGTNIATTLPSDGTDPLKVASLTIQKLSL